MSGRVIVFTGLRPKCGDVGVKRLISRRRFVELGVELRGLSESPPHLFLHQYSTNWQHQIREAVHIQKCIRY